MVQLIVTFEADDDKEARELLKNPINLDHDVCDSSMRKYKPGSLMKLYD